MDKTKKPAISRFFCFSYLWRACSGYLFHFLVLKMNYPGFQNFVCFVMETDDPAAHFSESSLEQVSDVAAVRFSEPVQEPDIDVVVAQFSEYVRVLVPGVPVGHFSESVQE
jgi:hypothetical protein